MIVLAFTKPVGGICLYIMYRALQIWKKGLDRDGQIFNLDPSLFGWLRGEQRSAQNRQRTSLQKDPKRSILRVSVC